MVNLPFSVRDRLDQEEREAALSHEVACSAVAAPTTWPGRCECVCPARLLAGGGVQAVAAGPV